MGGSDSPEEAPVGPVRGEADGSAEHEALGRLLDGAVGEGRRGQDLASRAGVRGDDGGGRAEGESHELGGVTASSHGSQRAVSQAAGESEEAAEDGEAARPGDRDGALFVAAVFPCCAPDGEGPGEEREAEEGCEEREDGVGVEYGFGAKECW